MSELVQYLDDLTTLYLSSQAESRHNKQYCYALLQGHIKESRYERWRECEFQSTRSFSNIFFEQKELCLRKINFFLHNKHWYETHGIQYSIGFGLFGPPGTGKTSLIKCIAAHTRRHIVVISLKLIRTKRELEDIFYETKYVEEHEQHPITVQEKIIVFEDIDCMGHLVIDRKHINSTTPAMTQTTMKVPTTLPLPREEPVTLDDLLNILDGLREQSGRILFITSNHYEKLDPALCRPGRIDVTLQMKRVNNQIFNEMWSHFKHDQPNTVRIRDYKYTPAEIIQKFF
jgi:chaperone BCS1